MTTCRMSLLLGVALMGFLLAGAIDATETAAPAAADQRTKPQLPRPGAGAPSPDQCELIEIHMQLPHGFWSAPDERRHRGDEQEPRCAAPRGQRASLRREPFRASDRLF